MRSTKAPINENTKLQSSSTQSHILIGIGGTFAGLTLLFAPFLAPGFRKLCVPWMGTPLHIIRAALDKLPNIANTPRSASNLRRLVDLGSGDGRIVIEAALRGYESVGIELNPWLVAYSYYRSWRMGVLSKVSFRMVNFFKVDLKPFDVIACFGASGIMETLYGKIATEAKDSALIVCYRFPLLNKKPIIKDNELFVYKKSDLV